MEFLSVSADRETASLLFKLPGVHDVGEGDNDLPCVGLHLLAEDVNDLESATLDVDIAVLLTVVI